MGKEVSRRALLAGVSVFQDEDAIRDTRDNPEVVRDEEEREPEIPLELAEEVEHRSLNGDIEG